MKHTKLIKLLKTLSNDEYLRLGKFLRSPFFNYSPSLVSFHDALKRYFPDFAEDKMQSDKIWARVFPKKEYNQTKFWRLCSDLSLLVEKYLVQLELEEPKPYAQHLLIKSLGRRNAFTLYVKKVKAHLAEMEKIEIKDGDWYREHISLLEDWYFHPLKDKLDNKDYSLSKLMDNLDTYFLLKKAKFGIGLVSLEKVLQRKYVIRHLSVLEESTEENILLDLYKLSLSLLQNEQESEFFELEKLLFENLDKLSENDKRLFFSNGLNYAVRKMNRGHSQYQTTTLKWYKYGLENTIIQTDGYISEIAFQNIVHIGCRVSKFEWVEELIEKYGNYLKEEIKEDCILFCRAILHFHKKDFNTTIKILTRENWIKNYLFTSRNLLIRALFESFLQDKDNFEILQNALQSFEIFILRTNLFPKKRLEAHLNLVRILKKLSKRIIDKKPKSDINQWLTKELNSKKKIISKSWLASQIY
ncbi:MAG: hypothetical protein ACI85O_003026 [Saprospiraceae bacterium]|jgi:hypothetical protein